MQGVYFRASALERARELKVNGSVRNEKDGSVFIEAEGTPEALAQFTAWCSHGPAGATVETIDTLEGTVKGYPSFEILR